MENNNISSRKPSQKGDVPTVIGLISQELINLYPDLRSKLADRYAAKYVRAVIDELKRAMARRVVCAPGELPFSATEMRVARLRYQGQIIYIDDFMARHERTRLIETRFVGAPGRLSRVVINPIYKDIIMDIIIEEPSAGQSARIRQEIEANCNRWIPVDSQSLRAYISQTQADIQGTGSRYDETKIENLNAAKMLLSQIETINGQEIIREVWVTADTGRQYGRYSSLQRQHRRVREAALGSCWKYDFKAASFSVILSLAHQIDPQTRTGAISDYIRNRKLIRERIARDIGTYPDRIKEVFTQLGFGAEVVNNPYKAIRATMQTDRAYQQLVDNPQFRWIQEDLQAAGQVIAEHFPAEFEGFLGCHYQDQLPAEPGRRRRRRSQNQKLAWIYQNSESYLMHEFTRLVRERSGLEPLLTVHDGVYYGQPIPNETQLDLRYLLQQDFAYVDFEEERIWPITTDQVYASRFADTEKDQLDHLLHIEREEQAAAQWADRTARTGPAANPRVAESAELGSSLNNSRAYTGECRPRWSESRSAEEYDSDRDPFYQDLTEQERAEALALRQRIINPAQSSQRPDWVQDLLNR